MNSTICIYGEKYTVASENRYKANKQPVLEIYEQNGCPAGVISVCIPGCKFETNETAISSDVPQEEVVFELEKIGFVERTGKFASSGYGRYPIVKILSEHLQS